MNSKICTKERRIHWSVIGIEVMWIDGNGEERTTHVKATKKRKTKQKK